MAATALDLTDLGMSRGLITGDTDTSAVRERTRQRRFRRLAAWLSVVAAVASYRAWIGSPLTPGSLIPNIDFDNPMMLIVLLTVVMSAVMILPYAGSGRSPHTLFRPEDLKVTMNDVVGADSTKQEVIRSLNLFLAHKTFSEEMGGNVRRGLLFSGPPGTGKTHLAKAMAGTADVPFLFVSATAFQSMFYGATARKIRSYFRALRKVARAEGGVIGFIEEFDAIGLARSGVAGGGRGEGASGVVNELLVQMQSFDEPPLTARVLHASIEFVNRWLPTNHRIRRPQRTTPNVLIVAATNRGSDLDPALLRPGRFDRTINFDLPVRRERFEIAAFYLNKKSHDVTVTPEDVAGLTGGYSPVQIERLLDEALITALSHGRRVMSWDDINEAKLTIEIGLSRDGEYAAAERWRIAIHESGHAIAALLLGRDVGLVSIMKRAQALGVTTHQSPEDNNLMTRSEYLDRIQICLGGLVAEELECSEMSNGAGSDLSTATILACQMVGALGMGGSMLSLDAASSTFGNNLVAKVLADVPSRAVAEQLLEDAKVAVTRLLSERRGGLRRAAQALLEHEELSGSEFAQLIAGPVAA